MWHQQLPAGSLSNAFITGIDQVCLVVPDFEKAIAGLLQLGIGPFKCWNVQPPALFDRTFRGNAEADWSMRLGVALVGTMQWEVIEPLTGDSLYREHLTRFGAGVHHLLLETRGTSFDESIARFAAQQLPFVQSAALNLPLKMGPLTVPAAPAFVAGAVSTRFGYVDSVDALKTTLEVARFPPGVSRPLGIRIGKADFFLPEGETNVESSLPSSLFDRVVKFTFLVNDLEATAKAWSAKAGVGPWHAVELTPQSFTRVTGEGLRDFRGQAAWTLVGNVLFELIQPTAGDSPHHRALASRGEGLHAVGLRSEVLGFEAARRAMSALNVKPLVEGVLHDGYEFALMDTTALAGTWIELLQLEAAPLFEALKMLPGRSL